MIDINSIDYTSGALGLIALMSGYIWNQQSKKINEIDKNQKNLPCNIIHGKMIKMSNDIEWIKKKLEKL